MGSPEKRSYELVNISDLQAAPRNARTHSKRQLSQIANSIRRFGFTSPVLIDDAHVIIAGHGRAAAAREVGLTEVPCLLPSSMSAADKRAYVIADNRLALNAGWDTEILAGELRGLMESGFEIELTGFDLPEVDLILHEAAEASTDPVGPEDEQSRGRNPTLARATGRPVEPYKAVGTNTYNEIGSKMLHRSKNT